MEKENKCATCIHCEMCRWIDEVNQNGCDFYAEPCEDAISRQAVEEMIKTEMPERGMWEIDGDKEKEIICEACVDLTQKLSKLQPVTPQQKTGHWIIVDDCENFIAKCSACGCIEDSRRVHKYPYCHCGAKMKNASISTEK